MMTGEMELWATQRRSSHSQSVPFRPRWLFVLIVMARRYGVQSDEAGIVAAYRNITQKLLEGTLSGGEDIGFRRQRQASILRRESFPGLVRNFPMHHRMIKDTTIQQMVGGLVPQLSFSIPCQADESVHRSRAQPDLEAAV